MPDQRVQLSSKDRTILLAIMSAIILFFCVDVFSDVYSGEPLPHVLIETAVAILAVMSFTLILRKSFEDKARLRRATENLQKTKEEAAYWQSQSKVFVEGLSQAIDAQFEKWNFSPSEKEVALLFLKGLSSREIAEIRGVTDRTIRAQATTIYEKSGLGGRAELSAFFLEDLLTASR